MAAHETPGKTDEWYTPKYVFDAMYCRFDMDVAAPRDHTHTSVPALRFLYENSLQQEWSGFVWMNPPFGKRNGLQPWLNRFFKHGNGIALTPDRTSAPWWGWSARRADGVLFVGHKIKFVKPDGTLGKQPGTGTCLWAAGDYAKSVLKRCGLGEYMEPVR